MKQLARNLRKHQTDSESLLWRHLRNRQLAGFKFRRQYRIGSYIVDFVCLERNLIIEIDGSQYIENNIKEIKRSNLLTKEGFKVIRFWNDEVLKNPEDVLNSVYIELVNNSSLQPSPLKGERENTNDELRYPHLGKNTVAPHISLAHGNGGRYMRELIDGIFARYLGNQYLDIQADAATVPVNNNKIVVTTDGFTVQPLEFPGGDIGSLAVHGTINDLAVAGATPSYLTLNIFIEEGFETALLENIIKSMANAAKESNVHVVAGDTKVVRRGEGGGLYMATTGIGVKNTHHQLGMNRIKDGDAILVSGPIGDHGTAVMLARGQFGLRGDLQSDAASILPLTRPLLPLAGLRFMRDPTRGGLATVVNEIRHATGLGIKLNEPQIPVRDSVRSVCEILGYDPLYLACEGRVIAVMDASQAQQALALWKKLPQGRQAAIIGHITNNIRYVVLTTALGGERILEELEDDPLPRIC